MSYRLRRSLIWFCGLAVAACASAAVVLYAHRADNNQPRPEGDPKPLLDEAQREYQGNLRFEPKGKKCQVNAVGWAFGPALVDLNNDGWLDLVATAGFISQDRNQPDG
ncbi:MAG TPA: VCBS repeat-containing protein [Gemmataceae bacterium]|jgi:hypothetical protein|nr:VCBS repeat-containing protein [Gemmataceae bacterium]